jgi:hypothetical protein
MLTAPLTGRPPTGACVNVTEGLRGGAPLMLTPKAGTIIAPHRTTKEKTNSIVLVQDELGMFL